MSELPNEAVADTLAKITKQQQMTLESCVKQLTSIIESGVISESNLKVLINVWRELDAIRELYFIRLLNTLKRGVRPLD
jgi:hypothetical protein